jgi:hypothetical protein
MSFRDHPVTASRARAPLSGDDWNRGKHSPFQQAGLDCILLPHVSPASGKPKTDSTHRWHLPFVRRTPSCFVQRSDTPPTRRLVFPRQSRRQAAPGRPVATARGRAQSRLDRRSGTKPRRGNPSKLRWHRRARPLRVPANRKAGTDTRRPRAPGHAVATSAPAANRRPGRPQKARALRLGP